MDIPEDIDHKNWEQFEEFQKRKDHRKEQAKEKRSGLKKQSSFLDEKELKSELLRTMPEWHWEVGNRPLELNGRQ